VDLRLLRLGAGGARRGKAWHSLAWHSTAHSTRHSSTAWRKHVADEAVQGVECTRAPVRRLCVKAHRANSDGLFKVLEVTNKSQI
jgi:hypothetical protein